MQDHEQPNIVDSAITAGKALAHTELKELAGIPALVIPTGCEVKTFENLMPKPMRTKQTVRAETPQSFIEYFNRFSSGNSAIFCDINNATFTGIIDYHATDKPAWREHKIVFTCQETEEWSEWKKNNNKGMTQTEFAYFIENNLEEIQNPAGAQMLEIATTLKAKTKTNFTSGLLLSNGQTQLEYVEEINGSAGTKGQFNIPETIDIGLRLFHGGEGYSLQARFRYRIQEGKLLMWYELIRPNKTHRAAVDDVFNLINDQCECSLIINGDYQ